MPSPRQARTASTLLNATAAASASVIASRMQAFANPATLLSPWHLSEARRMSAEKIDAATDGMQSASTELALLPWRMLQVAARPSSWTPAGWAGAWMEATGLWIGVGNAALRPATATAVRNRARLSRRAG